MSHRTRTWTLAVLIAAMLLPAASTWLYFDLFAGQGASMRLVYLSTKGLQALLPWLWVRGVLGEPVRLAWPSGKGIVPGAAFGLAVAASLLVLYFFVLRGGAWLAGMDQAVWTKIQEIGAAAPGRYLLFGLFLCLAHALFEEYYWRWFVFGRLRDYLAWPWAAALSGIGFALNHVLVLAEYFRPEQFWTAAVFFSFCVASGGAIWAWMYQRSGSLYGPWLSHALVDAAIVVLGFDLCARYWP